MVNYFDYTSISYVNVCIGTVNSKVADIYIHVFHLFNVNILKESLNTALRS